MASSDLIDESAIVEALRLSQPDERVQKLLNLQGRGLWHGDLADMRGDSPRRPSAETRALSPFAREAIARMATIRRFRDALNHLSSRCREVLRLHYEEGLPISDVAERLGITPRYTSTLIDKCLRRVAELSSFDGARERGKP
jgi:RNA polymerase sigma factor (sigma-70 family)